MNNTISRYQLFCTLIAIQSGGRYLAMPRVVATLASNDAWISVSLACAGVAIVAAAVAYMSSLFSAETVVQYMPKILGKYGAFFFNLMGCFAIISLLVFQTKTFSDTTRLFVLPHTPLSVIGGSLLLCSLYLVMQGIILPPSLTARSILALKYQKQLGT